ncbi:MAG: DUF485 domain-containing protein [Gammaproteobacteria bacterium]|nr:DUF485 domain-containing protein [Gammaproteobacteria bacterium]MBI5617435.1 DUF485 domain-containing protein [Gammaproteobacteria bacterium]
MQHLYRQIYADPRFHELEMKRGVLSWTLAIIVLATVAQYIAATAYFHEWFSATISPESSVTWGIVIGMVDCVVYILFVGFYIWRANNEFDNLKDAIVADAHRLAGDKGEK